MISVRHLTKRFVRHRAALDDVSFEVKKNEIMGLLGHNGAGKSTVLGVMLGMVRPQSGEVLIGGHSVQRSRSAALRQIGAIFEAPSFYEYMTGWDNLRALCALSGWWDEKEVWRVLELVNLKDRVRSKVSAYSHGMKQRL
ncbi:MAG TPA: ABC transporter ATP-binding protein, partial [Verrucomicrobiaceae bacterium]